jgi:hypothetical protein
MSSFQSWNIKICTLNKPVSGFWTQAPKAQPENKDQIVEPFTKCNEVSLYIELTVCEISRVEGLVGWQSWF